MCRAENHKYAVFTKDDEQCICIKNDQDILENDASYDGSSNCDLNYKVLYQSRSGQNVRLYCKVYEVDLFDKATSCDELYFKKNVYFWGKYKMSNGLTVLCEYSRPKIYNAGTNPSYNQKTQKLARESLMMTDALSVDDPAAGVTVQYQVINI